MTSQIDFKAVYGGLYRTIWNFHEKYHNRRDANSNEFWAELVEEFTQQNTAHGNGRFIIDMLVAVIDETERLYKGFSPNSTET